MWCIQWANAFVHFKNWFPDIRHCAIFKIYFNNLFFPEFMIQFWALGHRRCIEKVSLTKIAHTNECQMVFICQRTLSNVSIRNKWFDCIHGNNNEQNVNKWELQHNRQHFMTNQTRKYTLHWQSKLEIIVINHKMWIYVSKTGTSTTKKWSFMVKLKKKNGIASNMM